MYWGKMRKFNRITAWFMVLIVCFTMNMGDVYAADNAYENVSQEETDQEDGGHELQSEPMESAVDCLESEPAEHEEESFQTEISMQPEMTQDYNESTESAAGESSISVDELQSDGLSDIESDMETDIFDDNNHTERETDEVSDIDWEFETELLQDMTEEMEDTDISDKELTIEELLKLESVEDNAYIQMEEEGIDSLESFDSVPFNVTGKMRYTVLLLDCSGSMSGAPMTNLKKAAIRFSEQLFSANKSNHLAIVSYNSSSRVISKFTTSLEEAQKSINSLSAYGGTNVCSGLQTAESLFRKLPESSNIIKNIVLLSDGLPESGSTSKDGPYTSDDYGSYTYANAAFNKAKSLWDSYYIYTLGFFHAIAQNDIEFPRRFMKDLQNAGYYEVTDPDKLEFIFGEIAEDVLKGDVEFRYASGSERDYTAVCHYTDEYFHKDSCGSGELDGYDKSLSTASLCLALSAFGSNDGGSSDYSKKYKNVKELLEKLEFKNFANNDWFGKKPQSDSIGAAVASKSLTVDNDEYELIAVAIRGGGYESEWAGNFTLGRTGQHYGFAQAKNQVLQFLRSYIRDNKITGNIKIWITGYSRAAATANMVAGALVNGENLGNVSLKKENIYAYCFETPMGVQKSEITDKLKYNNIYNVVNKNDPVTKVAMSALDFTRFGSDFFLPDKISDGQGYQAKKNAMLDFYNKMDSFSEVGAYAIDGFKMKKIDIRGIFQEEKSIVLDDENNKSIQGDYLDTTINKLTKERIKTRDRYVSEFQNGIRTIFCALYGTLFPDQPLDRIWNCLNLFVDKLCRLNTLGKIVTAALNPFSSQQVSDVIEDIMEEAMNEAGINNYNPIALADFVKSAADLTVKFIVTHPNLTVTGISNAKTLAAAHYPELCLAWLMADDENYTNRPIDFDGNGNYRIIHINCPIDVDVYDNNGQMQAAIQGDVPQETGNTAVVVSLNEDGEKLVFLPANASYSIRLTATDEGQLNYSINEYSSSEDDITRIINYRNISVQKDELITASVPAYAAEELNNIIRGSTTEYTLIKSDGSEIQPDQELTGDDAQAAYYMITVLPDSEEQGVVSGQGIRQAGHFAQIEAAPADGWYFDGWYEGDTLVSKDIKYRFCVERDRTLIAHFTDDDSIEGVLPGDIPDGGVPDGLWVAGVEECYVFTGNAIKPEVRVYDRYTKLKEGLDYTIDYRNNIKANDASVDAAAPKIIITGKTNYTDVETVSFKIAPLDIGGDAFDSDNMAIAYQSEKKQQPIPELLWNDKRLKHKVDYTVDYYDSSKAGKLGYIDSAGEYYVELKGTGNFTGKRMINLTVSRLKMIDKVSVKKITNQSYTGSELTPALIVKDGKKQLTENIHYTIRYGNNVKVGTAYAVVSGMGEYCGTKRITFKITGVSLKKSMIEGLDNQFYGGMNNEPELKVSLKINNSMVQLSKDKDYTIKWEKNRNAGNATVILTGINGYTGTLKKTFKIKTFNIADNLDDRFNAVVENEFVPYAIGGAKPTLKVTFLKDNGKVQTLKEGIDYTASYKNNTSINAGSDPKKIPMVIIRGKGNFSGVFKPLNYKVTIQNIGNLTLTASDKVYQAKKKSYTTGVAITEPDGKVLKPGKDYKKELIYTYKNNTTLDDGTLRRAGAVIGKNDIIPAGTVVVVTAMGKGKNYTGSLSGEYRIIQSSIMSAKVSIPAQVYTGEEITLDKKQIVVKADKVRLALDQYEIVSYTNNVKKGTAYVTIKGLDNYGGTKRVGFRIKSKGFFWWWKLNSNS